MDVHFGDGKSERGVDAVTTLEVGDEGVKGRVTATHLQGIDLNVAAGSAEGTFFETVTVADAPRGTLVGGALEMPVTLNDKTYFNQDTKDSGDGGTILRTRRMP